MNNMNILRITSAVVSVVILSCTGAAAQTMNSAYFLDHYNLGHLINPAQCSADEVSTYFGLALGNSNVLAQTNLGPSSLFFPVDGELVFGLDKRVSASDFLDKFKPINQARAGINMSILNLGTRVGKSGFLTFDFGPRSMENVSAPKSLFEIMKLGVKDGNSYSISDFSLWSSNYAECAVGYSMKFGNKLRAGIRVKALVGLALAEMNISNITVQMDKEKGKVYASGNGMFGISTPFVTLSKTGDKYDFPNFELGEFGLAGFGFGVDIGAIWTPVENLDVDLAVQDIGGIRWNRNISGLMEYKNKELSTEKDVTLDDLLEFKGSECGRTSVGLPTTIRVGAKYRMPFYQNLSARVLGTFVTGQYCSYSDIRVGATITPIKNISATVNYGYTPFGSTMGAALNFNLGFLNFFLGADSVVNPLTSDYIPINPVSITVTTGLIIQIKIKNKNK